MSHISAAVEYALHCLLYLVDLPEEVPPPSARDLADLRTLPVKYVFHDHDQAAQGEDHQRCCLATSRRLG